MARGCIKKTKKNKKNKKNKLKKNKSKKNRFFTSLGKTDHACSACPHINAVCRFCQKVGHLQSVCRSKLRQASNAIKRLGVDTVHRVRGAIPPIYQQVMINGHLVDFEIDSGANDTLCSEETWLKLGKPELQEVNALYKVADGNPLPVLGQFETKVCLDDSSRKTDLQMVVTQVPRLNLLGRSAMLKLGLTDLTKFFDPHRATLSPSSIAHLSTLTSADNTLQQACEQLCQEYPDLFRSELGCLKDYELDVKFKPNAKPVFCKPRPVPFSVLEDLNEAYEAGIKQGVWEFTDFNSYGTPVVPVRKTPVAGQTKAAIRVCGDYSVTVNSQLEDHRQPIPLPEDLMRRLGGGYYFSKIDLASAYNQISLSPESQKRLALSTHRGVLL